LMAWRIARSVVEVPLEAWPIRARPRMADRRYKACQVLKTYVKMAKTGPMLRATCDPSAHLMAWRPPKRAGG
jgi:hypothetical protein